MSTACPVHGPAEKHRVQVRFVPAGITASDIEIGRVVNNLKLAISDTGDSLIISDYLLNPSQRIEQFIFQDSSQLPDAQTIIDSLITITGTDGDDVLNGSDGFETIWAST